MTTKWTGAVGLFALTMLLVATSGCAPNDGKHGGPVAGPADTHCQGQPPQPTSEAACHPNQSPADAGTDQADGGTDQADGGAAIITSDYGATLFGSEGDDDDCKYHVKWTASLIREGSNVTFTVTATHKTDGSPLTGANPIAEVFLSPTHPSPSVPTGTELSPGVYAIGPVDFDAPGKWTVRFHFYEDCVDQTPDSPHGHAAFYVNVP